MIKLELKIIGMEIAREQFICLKTQVPDQVVCSMELKEFAFIIEDLKS